MEAPRDAVIHEHLLYLLRWLECVNRVEQDGHNVFRAKRTPVLGEFFARRGDPDVPSRVATAWAVLELVDAPLEGPSVCCALM